MKLSHATVAVLSLVLMCTEGCFSSGGSNGGDFSLARIQEANSDILGEAALRQPGGPSYEFFAKAMPPLRYVDANFRCYPSVLSAPSNKTKARLVSDGSSVNARARSLTWSHEQGTPCMFYMGDKREPFGKDLANLQGPKF